MNSAASRAAVRLLLPVLFILIPPAARAQCVDVVGQIGGAALAVAVQGDTAYLVQGPSLITLDVRDPGHVRPLGWCALEQASEAVAVGGSRVYAAGVGVFEVVDVSNPERPKWLGAWRGLVHGEAVAVAGQTVFVADGPDLLVLDASQPAKIRLAGIYNNGFQAIHALQLAKNNILYAATDGGLLILDVSQKTRPAFRALFDGTPEVAAMWGRGVVAKDGVAYLATDAHLLAIDVREPRRPFLAGVAELPCGEGLALAEGALYAGDRARCLAKVELAAPERPKPEPTKCAGTWRALAAQGGRLYAADPWFGLRIMELGGEEGPKLVGEYRTDCPQEIAVARGQAYVANGARGLELIDARQPDRLWRRGAWAGRKAWTQGVALDGGGRVYAADAEAGLEVFSQDAAAGGLRLRGSFKTPGDACKVAVAGQFAYVADGRQGLQTLEVSQPEAIKWKSRFATVGEAVGVAVEDKVVYALSLMRQPGGRVGASHMEAINLQWSERPRLLGGYVIDQELMGLDFREGCAFLSDGWRVLQVELNDDDIPELSDAWEPDELEYAQDVAFHGGLMYVADPVRGLLVFDTNAPRRRSLVGMFEVPGGYAKAVAVGEDGLIYLGSETSGVWTLRYKPE